MKMVIPRFHEQASNGQKHSICDMCSVVYCVWAYVYPNNFKEGSTQLSVFSINNLTSAAAAVVDRPPISMQLLLYLYLSIYINFNLLSLLQFTISLLALPSPVCSIYWLSQRGVSSTLTVSASIFCTFDALDSSRSVRCVHRELHRTF